MAPASGIPPIRRPRGTTALMVGCGIVVLALVATLAVLAARGGSSAQSAPGPSASPSPSGTASRTASDIYQRVGPSVAVVRTAKGALGTGVVATSAGAVLTANHVIADGSAISLVFADGTQSKATVASADIATDIAVLTPSTLPQPIVAATIGGAAAVGSAVVAIGNPLGLTYSVSSGIVSGLNRTERTANRQLGGLIQFDASVNPGSSGGPLLNGRGNVIGIVIAIADPAGDDAFAGIAFAVPIGAALGGAGNGPGNGPQI